MQAIGYVPLLIQVKHPKAQVHLKGYKYERKHTGDWTGNVRPGRYVVIVKYPGQSPVKREVLAWGSKPKHIAFLYKSTAPRQRSPSVPAYAWVGYVGGGLAVVAGTVLVGFGLSTRQGIQSCWTDPQCSTITSEGARNIAVQSAETNAWIGVGIAGTGIVLLISGGVVHAMSRKANAAHKALLPRGKHALLDVGG